MRLAPIALSGLALVVLGGCVPQSQYDDLMNAYRSKEQQLLQLQGEYDTSRANEDMLRRQLAEAAADLARARELAGAGGAEIDALQKRYEDLLAQVSALSPLPESVNVAIEELVSMYPDLIEFDERRGLIRFKSDVTFDLGSAKLTSKAASVLKQFASILNKGDASDLEVRVVGHTDNVPIRRSETVRLHPTNVHLSAHRAISVRDALVGDGVDASRFMIGGYGEFRPVAENGQRGNEMNRRVEVFLAPMPSGVAEAGAGAKASAPAPASAPAKAAATEVNEK
jgi:chemotaxis protein MotB